MVLSKSSILTEARGSRGFWGVRTQIVRPCSGVGTPKILGAAQASPRDTRGRELSRQTCGKILDIHSIYMRCHLNTFQAAQVHARFMTNSIYISAPGNQTGALSPSQDPTTLLVPSLPPQHRILPPHPLRTCEHVLSIPIPTYTHQRTPHRLHDRLISRPQKIRKTKPLLHRPSRQRAHPMPTAFQKPVRQQAQTVPQIHSRVSSSRLHPFPVSAVGAEDL